MIGQSEKEEYDINDLIQIINNPQHETDLELPDLNTGGADSSEQSDKEPRVSLYDIGVPNASPPH
jgi:hypothetical protein